MLLAIEVLRSGAIDFLIMPNDSAGLTNIKYIMNEVPKKIDYIEAIRLQFGK
jgi:hypothetical protein